MSKDFIKRVKKAITSPSNILLYLMATRSTWFRFIPDKQYVKMEYRLVTGKKLNLQDPKRFNEKLQWIKLNDHNPLYTKLVDKAAVKPIIADQIGEQYIIPTLGVWNNFEDINFETLPEQFILKCTHDSGGNVICEDKSKLDKKKAKTQIDACLKRRYFYSHREWPYKNLKPRIIAEPLMVDEPGKPLRDYKLFCFNGKVEFLFVASDRGAGTTKFDFYDSDFKRLPVKQHYPNSQCGASKPHEFEKMKELASILSKDIPAVRVDFYEVKGKVYFGEMTFCHFAGIEKFEPDEYDYKFGTLIDLNMYNKD